MKPTKHIDDLQQRLNQSGQNLIIQRNSVLKHRFNPVRFKQALGKTLQHLSSEQIDSSCGFEQKIPAFNKRLEGKHIQSIDHIGSGLFRVFYSKTNRQVINIDGKVLMRGVDFISDAGNKKDGVYFTMRTTEKKRFLLKYDRQTGLLKKLIDAKGLYTHFYVFQDYNIICATKKGSDPRETDWIDMDTMKIIPQEERAARLKNSREGSQGSTDTQDESLFGISGLHIKKKIGNKYAVYAIDPANKQEQRITKPHACILPYLYGNGLYICGQDEDEQGQEIGYTVYDLLGKIQFERRYPFPIHAIYGCDNLPRGFFVDTSDAELQKLLNNPDSDPLKSLYDHTGKKVDCGDFLYMHDCGLGDIYKVAIRNESDDIQFGLFSLKNQSWIIMPTLIDDFEFIHGAAVLSIQGSKKLVTAKEILACESQHIQYK